MGRGPPLAKVRVARLIKLSMLITPSVGTNSDLMCLIKAYEALRSMQTKSKYAFDSFATSQFLRRSAYETMTRQMQTVQGVLQDCHVVPPLSTDVRKDGQIGGPKMNTNSDCIEAILMLLVAGFGSDNLAVAHGNVKLCTSRHKVAFIHPSSINDPNRRRLILKPAAIWSFAEASSGTADPRLLLRDTNPVSPIMALLFSKSHVVNTNGSILVNGWLSLHPRLSDGTAVAPNIVASFVDVVKAVSSLQHFPALIMEAN
jgi:hypothetical protein